LIINGAEDESSSIIFDESDTIQDLSSLQVKNIRFSIVTTSADNCKLPIGSIMNVELYSVTITHE
jgi:hypothetical protein